MKKILSFLAIAPGVIAFVPPSPFLQRSLVPPMEMAKKVVDATKTEKISSDEKYCIPLEEVCLDDLPKVGGKTASLGEMIQQLTPLGVAVPGGFAVSSTAYDAVLDRYQLRERLHLLLKDLDGKYQIIRKRQAMKTNVFWDKIGLCGIFF
jgi:pyruvate,water dikinase